jgi:NADH-quinone oxidoreductase subunit G
VVKPLGETRPAWKVLRVLGTMLGLPGFEADSSQTVLGHALPGVSAGQVVDANRLDNATAASIDTRVVDSTPCVASIYQLDGLVRRAPSLQLTADARSAQPTLQGVSA